MHIQLNDNKDTFKWNLKANRIFTVHSMYLAVINNGVIFMWYIRNMFWIETTSTSGRNDVVFDKSPMKTFMQVVFRTNTAENWKRELYLNFRDRYGYPNIRRHFIQNNQLIGLEILIFEISRWIWIISKYHVCFVQCLYFVQKELTCHIYFYL
ncbi:hypothetical protein ACJX0J_014735, partial [Zea mays]